MRTEHTADCVCWVHTRSNEAAESVKRIDQSASACILNTVTGRFDLTTRSAALPSSRRRPLERCFKPEIVSRLPTLSMIRRTSLSRWSRRCWQFQRHRFACFDKRDGSLAGRGQCPTKPALVAGLTIGLEAVGLDIIDRGRYCVIPLGTVGCAGRCLIDARTHVGGSSRSHMPVAR